MDTQTGTGKWAIRITALAAVAGVGLSAGVAIMQDRAAQPRIYVRGVTDVSDANTPSTLAARILVTLANVGEQRVVVAPDVSVSVLRGTGVTGSSLSLMFRSAAASTEAVLAPATLEPGQEVAASSTELGAADLPGLGQAMVVTFRLASGDKYRGTLTLTDASSNRVLIKEPKTSVVLWGASAMAVREQ